MKHPGRTAPFIGSNGEILAGSIAEIAYLRLGGLDQWVMIRGQNVGNPLLILLHGGPGASDMRLFRHFNSSLERFFTVVYWEQRGTNKSFSRTIPKSSMTVEQFVVDLDELVDAVRARFGKSKVAIYGHSWGSVLGVLYSARFPEKVSAYVGAGQVGDLEASERICYDFTLAEAERRNNHKAARQLRAIGPPPHTARQVFAQRRWLRRFVGLMGGMSRWQFLRLLLRRPECSVMDLPNILRGFRFSVYSMWKEVANMNLASLAPAVRTPVFVFVGRHDRIIAPEISVAYFDALRAPSKQLVWFEASGHSPPFEEPEKFNQAMVELVRPRG